MSIVRRALSRGRREIKKYARLRVARQIGITFTPPNYIYEASFTPDSVVVDCGCANDADFSAHIMDRFGATCYGVDPTRKHAPALLDMVRRRGGRFHYLPYAVAASSGTLRFAESEINVSGSLLDDHNNVLDDPIQFYDVQTATLSGLIDIIGVERVDFIKLDLEGAEYELITSLGESDLEPYGQVFIEFHHHCIDRYSIADTQRAVTSICARGFQSFSLDDHNYLFYRR